VRVLPTLQLVSHPSIWAIGDILDFPEGKRASNTRGQLSVLVPNLLVFLRDTNAKLRKKYTPSAENIVLTNGAVR
jgi:NADH dehydrogenase FAD-containing subunit